MLIKSDRSISVLSSSAAILLKLSESSFATGYFASGPEKLSLVRKSPAASRFRALMISFTGRSGNLPIAKVIAVPATTLISRRIRTKPVVFRFPLPI